jgi:hypothetical protein
MSDILLKPITRKLLLEKVEFWTQNKATARKTKQPLSFGRKTKQQLGQQSNRGTGGQLVQKKATDKQLQCSHDSPASCSRKSASLPPQKFKAVVFGKVVLGVCTCNNGWLPQRSLFCSW